MNQERGSSVSSRRGERVVANNFCLKRDKDERMVSLDYSEGSGPCVVSRSVGDTPLTRLPAQKAHSEVERGEVEWASEGFYLSEINKIPGGF